MLEQGGNYCKDFAVRLRHTDTGVIKRATWYTFHPYNDLPKLLENPVKELCIIADNVEVIEVLDERGKTFWRSKNDN